MATNDASAYGKTFRCIRDMDELFSTVEGLAAVRQDALHRITTDDVLGDDGSGSLVISGWGYDCRRLLGMTTTELATVPPVLAEVLQRDPRIETADVEVEPVVANGQLVDVQLTITCTTALGPFTLIKAVSDLTADDLVGQP